MFCALIGEGLEALESFGLDDMKRSAAERMPPGDTPGGVSVKVTAKARRL